jgi:O-glycosyl hydrolase
LASAIFACGCAASGGSSGSGGSGDTTGSGGSTGSGGNGSGGTTGSGGSGSGGNTASGGTTGSGGSGSGGNGSGGTIGSGGATGSGGTSGTGGTTASGGTTGSGGHGGATGSGGTTGLGGSTGLGGNTASGGATGSGGSSGSGGTTGAGGSGTGGAGGGSSSVTVQLGQTEQMIEGFGINDNWAAGSTPAALFTTSGSGLGLTILRTGMSDTGAFYNSGETTGDVATLKAGAGSDAKLIGSVWSPPASCKSANTINPSDTNGLDGGHLMASCYTSWATTIANFAGSNGFYAMSIGNEPDFNSCGSNDPCNGQYPTTLMTAQEMTAYVKIAGPLLKAKGVKVIAPEASEWLHQWSNVSAGPDVNGHESSDPLKCGCFPDKNTNSCASACNSGMGYDYGHAMAADSTAWGAFDILGVHQYDSQSATAWPSDVNGGKPNKEVWETEMSGVKWWPQQGPSCDIANGVAVAGWIHSALTVGQASAWLWWWYQASGTDDNEGLLLKSGSTASGCSGTDTKRHYTLGNFSKFIRPGYNRVDVTGTVPSGVQLSAYKGSDGTVVVVAINSSTSTVSVPITISGGTTTPASMTPTVTDASNNLVAKTAVTVSGGSFTASLGGPSVTTFVGK